MTASLRQVGSSDPFLPKQVPKCTNPVAITLGQARPGPVDEKTMHLWEIRISNDAGQLVCASKLTVSIVSRQSPPR
jgi:hypothetical protein